MNQKDYEKFLSEYLKFVLTLEIESTEDSNSTSSDPTSILNLSWEDCGNEDFGQKITKKFFGFSSKTQSKFFDNFTGSSRSTLYRDKVTELVEVPTSNHVAQILGKKGTKIRALRETTNTYIRSPLPQEQPIFIVKGRKEDVAEAVKYLKSASDFFTTIESEKSMLQSAAIKSSQGKVIVVKFSIPVGYVGLVVGVKGCTIKAIEKQSKTFIQSPVMDSEPLFIITGSSENCEIAMRFICRYLALRGVGRGTLHEVSEGESDSFFAWTLD